MLLSCDLCRVISSYEGFGQVATGMAVIFICYFGMLQPHLVSLIPQVFFVVSFVFSTL